MGALKVIKKALLVAKTSTVNIINEKDILFAISGNTPFCVQMYDHFQDAYHVYIAMEFCNGGEIFEVQSREVGRKFEPSGMFCARLCCMRTARTPTLNSRSRIPSLHCRGCCRH